MRKFLFFVCLVVYWGWCSIAAAEVYDPSSPWGGGFPPKGWEPRTYAERQMMTRDHWRELDMARTRERWEEQERQRQEAFRNSLSTPRFGYGVNGRGLSQRTSPRFGYGAVQPAAKKTWTYPPRPVR